MKYTCTNKVTMAKKPFNFVRIANFHGISNLSKTEYVSLSLISCTRYLGGMPDGWQASKWTGMHAAAEVPGASRARRWRRRHTYTVDTYYYIEARERMANVL